MKNSPLQLLRYVVPEASCAASPACDPKKPFDSSISGQLSVTAAVTRQKAPQNFPGHAWSVELSISQTLKEGQNFPYTFKVSLVGFFTCRDELPPGAEEERFVRVNASSMLYGAAREIVCSLTARGPWGPLFLPGISFYDKDAKPKEEAAPAPRTD